MGQAKSKNNSSIENITVTHIAKKKNNITPCSSETSWDCAERLSARSHFSRPLLTRKSSPYEAPPMHLVSSHDTGQKRRVTAYLFRDKAEVMSSRGYLDSIDRDFWRKNMWMENRELFYSKKCALVTAISACTIYGLSLFCRREKKGIWKILFILARFFFFLLQDIIKLHRNEGNLDSTQFLSCS